MLITDFWNKLYFSQHLELYPMNGSKLIPKRTLAEQKEIDDIKIKNALRNKERLENGK